MFGLKSKAASCDELPVWIDLFVRVLITILLFIQNESSIRLIETTKSWTPYLLQISLMTFCWLLKAKDGTKSVQQPKSRLHFKARQHAHFN